MSSKNILLCSFYRCIGSDVHSALNVSLARRVMTFPQAVVLCRKVVSEVWQKYDAL